MQDRKRIIERIKKLLEVTEGRGATEGEAINAALAAQRLMAEYDVEERELGEEPEQIGEAYAKRGRCWETLLAGVVADNFRCKIFTSQRWDGGSRRTPYVVFYGYENDAEAARVVFERLAKVGHREATRSAKRREEELLRAGDWDVQRRNLYDDFVTGFIVGVKEVLEKQSQELMIVCPKKVGDAFKERSRGFTRGRAVKFHQYGDAETTESGRRSGRDAVMAGRVTSGAMALPA